MKNRPAVLAVAIAVWAGLASAAAAQPSGVEVSIGYQHLYVTNDPGTTFPIGLAVEVAASSGAFAFVAEGGWSHRSERHEPDEITFTAWHAGGGLRWSHRQRPRVSPYVQMLVGLAFHRTSGEIAGADQSNGTTHLIMQPGGGVNMTVRRRLGVFGAVDYRRTLIEGSLQGVPSLNQVRVFAGLRFSLD